MSRVWRSLLGVLLLIVGLLPLSSPGTGDVSYWVSWIEAIERDGFIAGYIPVYPPMAWVILQGVAFFHQAFNIDIFLAVKWSLVFFLLLTDVIFLLWTRNLLLTAFLHLSLVLSSVSLGYVDIWLAPPVLLAFWALKERKVFLFCVFFSIACLTKQTPLIIGPFLLAYVIRDAGGIKQWKATLKVLLRDLVLPAVVLFGGMALIFGIQRFMEAYLVAGIHTGLTGNALNYNWLTTYYLRLTQPDRFGPIDGPWGLMDYSAVTEWGPADWPIDVVPRILFALFFLSTLVIFLRRSNSFENLLRFTTVGYLAYFTWNIGVHENHLFLAPFLAFILCWVSPRDSYTTFILTLMANINLFLFYGFSGGDPYQRIIGMDISVPLALFNVVFFLVFWATTCWFENLNLETVLPARQSTDTATT